MRPSDSTASRRSGRPASCVASTSAAWISGCARAPRSRARAAAVRTPSSSSLRPARKAASACSSEPARPSSARAALMRTSGSRWPSAVTSSAATGRARSLAADTRAAASPSRSAFDSSGRRGSGPSAPEPPAQPAATRASRPSQAAASRLTGEAGTATRTGRFRSRGWPADSWPGPRSTCGCLRSSATRTAAGGRWSG